MVWILIVLWLLCIVFSFVTRNFHKGQWNQVTAKGHPFRNIYPMCQYIYDKCGLSKITQKEEQVKSAVEVMSLKGEEQSKYELYVLKKVSISIVSFFSILTLLLIFEAVNYIFAHNRSLSMLSRPKGEVATSIAVSMEVDEERRENIMLQIMPEEAKEMSEEEKLRFQKEQDKRKEYNKICELIHSEILQENGAFSFVGCPVYLRKEVENSNISIQWFSSSPDIIDLDGMIHNAKLSNEVEVNLKATIIDERGQKLGEYQEVLNVIPKKEFEYEMWKEDLVSSIKENRKEDSVQLPKEYKGHRIQWKSVTDYSALEILVFGFIVSILIYLAMDERVLSELKKRKEQMLLDYPEIVNKLSLMIGAGMTVTGAWDRIVGDYEKLAPIDAKKRHAYEEMKLTNQEMKLGVSEQVAFNEFGRRCMHVEYMKLSSVLIQNLRKGGDGLTQMLAIMSKEAFEQRKIRARQMGEKAGTKLLFPMLIMLILVLVIIMVPAFWSMKI